MKITRCKLSKKTQRKLLEFFVAEVTARTAANLLDVQPNSVALFYKKVRQVIMYHLDQDAKEVFDGQIELDESYFGDARKGKRGRGAAGKVIVFGLLKRNGKVYTVIVPDTKSITLMPVISNKITPDSVVYTDHWHSYNALDVAGFSHHRINHSSHFADGQNHINGIENFWNQAKRVLRKYNGIDRNAFPLFIKDEKHCFARFRFNYGSPKQQLNVLLKWTEI